MKIRKNIWGLVLLVAVLAFALLVVRRIYSPTGEGGFGVAELRHPISPAGGGIAQTSPKPSPSAIAQPTQVGQDSGGQGSAAPATASGAAPPALDPSHRTFVVDSDLTVAANGQECALTPGDVITRLTDTPDGDQNVNASVAATKKGDCASGQTVAVKVDDLQEMYNHFQENIPNGMGELANKQGTGGMPKAPDTGTRAGAVPPPPADTTAAKTLQGQLAAADRPAQLRFESGVRLWIRMSRISRKPDGSFGFQGTLLQPVLAGHFELDQGSELAGYGMINNGRVTVRVTGFTLWGASYTLQGASGSNRQLGTGPAVEITPGKLLEVWFASSSVYQKTP
jgi:hypothetical protein